MSRKIPAELRFWPKVAPAGALDCWEWIASRNPDGYGTFRDDRRRNVRAHRWAYEALVAPIPQGLQLDHLCRNRACVNPWHLEPVTNRVNARRGIGGGNGKRVYTPRTHCSKGHEFTEENTRVMHKKGETFPYRICRECSRARRRVAHLADTATTTGADT